MTVLLEARREGRFGVVGKMRTVSLPEIDL